MKTALSTSPAASQHNPQPGNQRARPSDREF